MALILHDPPIEWCPSGAPEVVTRPDGAMEVWASGWTIRTRPRVLRLYGHYLILHRPGCDVGSRAERASPAHLLVLRRTRKPWLLIAYLDGRIRSERAVETLEAYVPESKRRRVR